MPRFDQATFYRYRLVNRNTLPFEDAYFGLFVDPDLGDAADDYVGRTRRGGSAFTYNARDTDNVYGTPPGRSGTTSSTGPPPRHIRQWWGRGCTNDPSTARRCTTTLQGRWNNGTPITEGGIGYLTDGDTTTWAFPGDPVTGAFWSEVNADGNGTPNPGGDRRNTLIARVRARAGGGRAFDLALVFAPGRGPPRLRHRAPRGLDAVQAALRRRLPLRALVLPPPGTLPARPPRPRGRRDRHPRNAAV
jgi:hypothetical protein